MNETEKNREEAKRKLLEVATFLKGSAMGLNDCLRRGIGTDLATLRDQMNAHAKTVSEAAKLAGIDLYHLGSR